MHSLKEHDTEKYNQAKIPFTEQVTGFIESLPYRLTGAQMDAVRDIMADMNSEHVMNRLVQGDVGSLKC